MDAESIEMSAEEVRNFLEQLWITVSDSENHSIVKWVKGGRIFRLIKEEIFYSEFCPLFCAECDKNYFDYFVKTCGFKRIPPLDCDFFHEDFSEHEFARVKKIKPTQTLYTPAAYYSYVLEIPPSYEVPSIDEESCTFGIVEETLSTLKIHGSEKSKAVLIEDTNTEIEVSNTLGSSNNLKDALSLDLANFPSDHSPESTPSTLVPDSFSSTDSGISCFISESLCPKEVLNEIPMKKEYEKVLPINLDECKLEEQASDSSESTVTSGSNSPSFLESESRTDFKFNESSDK